MTNKRKQKTTKINLLLFKFEINFTKLSQIGDSIWDSLRQVSCLAAGSYLVYLYIFNESTDAIQDAWKLAVGGVLIITFVLDLYNINHQARSIESEQTR